MTAAAGRLHGLDLARYLVLSGMVLVNFRLAMGGDDAEGVVGSLFRLLEGKASATFVTLAGLGLVLASQRQPVWSAIGQAWRRAIVLAVLGLLKLTVFPADILHYYALYFVLGALWLRAPRWLLLVSILALAAFSFFALLHWDYSEGWDWHTLHYAGLWEWRGAMRNLWFNGFHPVSPWFCFFLLGMLLARLDLARPRVQAGLVLSGAVLLACGHGLQQWGQHHALALWLGTQPMPPGPAYLLAGAGAACLVIGSCLWLVARWPDAYWHPFTAAGRMTLTLYVAHILLGMGALEAMGVLDSAAGLPAVVLAALAFVVPATALAAWWSARYRRGPLEALMHRVIR